MKILAICVHPNLTGNHSKGDIKKSFANNIILQELANYNHVTTHIVSEEYPDLQIDVRKEQAILSVHDLILIIGPIYWYSLPALGKQWIDEVLLYGWAYGSQGKALRGKEIQLVLTSGSNLDEYTTKDIGNTIEELFTPYQRSFEYCNMIWKPIQFIGGINSQSIATHKDDLVKRLRLFAKDLIESSQQ